MSKNNLIEKAMGKIKERKKEEKKESVYNKHEKGEYKNLKVKKPKQDIL